MKKIALFLLGLLGISIGYGIVCSLAAQQSDDAVCVSVHPPVYLRAGVLPVFPLIVTGLLFVSLFSFIPNGFICDLYKPPQHS